PDALRNALLAAKTPEKASDLLADWRRKLRNLRPEPAAKMIREFLATKQDVPTHLPFVVAPAGSLKSAPTLRVFLMDELARVDKAAAAAIAENILADWSSPDEWAVALRNYAQGSTNPNKDAFLINRMQHLLRYEPSQHDPSVGYLESFDVAVYLGGTSLTPLLCDLVRSKENQAVAHAAYLALDRLTLNDAEHTLQLL